MENLIFLLLGWLLGLFGPWLTDLIQKPYRRSQIKKSLFIELKGLRFRLATLVFVIASHNSTLDRKLLEWIEPIIRADRSHYEGFLKEQSLETLMTLNDEQLYELTQSSPSMGDSLTLKKYNIPFLSANMSSLSIFTPEFQRLALDILSQLVMMHEQIDVARFNYEKTFDSSLSQHSQNAIRINLPHTYGVIANQCRRLADTIGLILERSK